MNPSITTEEVMYFFEKLDVNDDGRVSIKELEAEMQKNHISLESRSETFEMASSWGCSSLISMSLRRSRISE